MEIRVLGPLVVSDDGRDVPISRARCRAVLALLVSRHPEPVSVDGLAHALWTEVDADRAKNLARVHVRYLRQALAGHDDVLPIDRAGYRLRIDRRALDVARFADESTLARELAAGGSPTEAIAHFERAIGEWHGSEAYDDFAGIEAFRVVRTKLAEERLDVVHGYCRTLLDHDYAEEVLRVLPTFVAEDLTREDLAACLVLAYFRTGRQRDALGLVGRVKDALAESGLRPSETLTSLAESIVVEPETLAHHRPAILPVRATRRGARDATVGREAERRALEAAWESAESGSPQLVYVHGPGGIGKTTVVQRLVADHPGADVVVGQCEPDSDTGYRPFPTLVRGILATGQLSSTSPSVLAELARLSPDLAEELPTPSVPAEPGAGRARLFEAVATVIAETYRPRLVVIEDLHWARFDALSLLRHVLRSARGQLAVVATFRTDNETDRLPFATERARGRLARPDVDIPLGPMSRSEVTALVDVIAPAHHRISWHTNMEELVDVSAGHPLRLVEVLKQLELDPDTPISEVAPDDALTLIRRRLTSATELTQGVLRAASVAGRKFSLSFVAAVAEYDEADTLRGLESAIDEGLIVEGDALDEFAFAHPLYRNAVYATMARARRARLHLRVGSLHEHALLAGQTDTGWAEAARHLVGALPLADAARAARAARRAGDDAAARYAHQEAAGWYRLALEHAGPDPLDRPRLQLLLGSELELSGDLPAARDQYFAALDAAERTDDLELLVDAVVAATPRVGVLEPDFGRRLQHYVDVALQRADRGNPIRIPLLRAAIHATFYLDATVVDAHLAELRALVAAHPSPHHRHLLLGMEYMVADGRQPDPQLELSRELCAASSGPDLVLAHGLDQRRLLHELLRCGLVDEFDDQLDQMRTLAAVTSIPFHRYWAEALLATRQLMRENGPEVEAQIDAAALLGLRAGIPYAPGLQILQTFLLRYQQGRTREVTRDLQTPVIDAPPVLAGTALLALSFAAAERAAPARQTLDRVVADRILLPRNNFWFGAVAMFADVAASCGSASQRALLRAALEPVADQFLLFGTGGAVVGTGRHWLGRLARADGDQNGAREHLRAAAQLCSNSDAPFWEQRARSDLDRLPD